MNIQQISVFLENRRGRLEEFTQLLGDNSIDLIALSIADTTNFGIVRAIVNDNQRTVDLLRSQGYTASLTDVLAVAVSDTPGGLAEALSVLGQGGISIEYLYSFVRRVGDAAVIIFKVDQPDQAAALLAKAGIKLLSPEEVA